MSSRHFARACVALALCAGASPLFAQTVAEPGGGDPSFHVFRVNSATSPPAVTAVISPLSYTQCRRPWEARVTDSEALQPLRDKARALGANGLTEVTIDRHRTDMKAMCWQKVTVTATPVVFASEATR